ncbi:MAG TPA: two-component regulator propeller domain-containing protein [Bacteroidales bacterium]|nr:two-component regulator propeller domain-containing protein [Bacteroidales bacterium]
MLPCRQVKILSTFLLCFFLFSAGALSQKYGFRNYGAEYDIPDGFIYTINQTNDGFLWVGTGSGMARFDGYNYYRVSYPDSVDSRNPYVSYKDSKGTVWIGCNDGSVFYTAGNNLRKLNLNNSRSISQIVQGPDSLLYIVPQGRAIFCIDVLEPDSVRQFLIPEDQTLFSAAFSDNGRLLAGTQGSILFFEPGKDSLIVRDVVEGFDYSSVTSVCNTGDGKFLVGTEDNGLFILDTNHENELRRIKGYPEFSALNIKSIMYDPAKRIWISTFGSGVIEFNLGNNDSIKSIHHYNTTTGLPSNDARLVFRDIENDYWFGLFGEGLSMLVSYAYGFYTPGRTDQENDVIYTRNLGRNYLLGTPAGYHIFDADDGVSLSFNPIIKKTGNAVALSYYLDDNDRLWIGTNGKGLYMKEPNGQIRLFYRSGDTGSDEIRDIKIDNDYIWLATTNGVIVLNKKSGSELKRFGTNESLPHNFINSLFPFKGIIYIGTETDRLYSIDNKLNLTAGGCQMTGSTKNRILAFSADKEGTIWTATSGNGIFGCSVDSVKSKTRSDGLFSNYCYGILADSENNIWVGHEKGFSVVDSKTGVIRSYGSDYTQQGVCRPGGMFESADGKIFLGTSSGLVLYNKKADPQISIPAINNIVSINIDDREYSYTPVLNLPYRKYRVTINYSGINFSDPDKVYYSTYLENFDTDWSPITKDRKVSYNLSDGDYKFHVVSLDENGVSVDSGIILSIVIERPLYKKWWFISMIVIAVACIIILIIRQREKSQKKIQAYLEDELDKRTSLIMKQKGEIELQNIEITDSINYAKRIQSSILPDVGKLKENFNEAFVLFHPRDIVSGDFYWFDKVDDDHFIVVCADSTGHGVPGAFMSMIGSTLLQDIVTRKKISRPSQILSLLDQQIFSTLNQNFDMGVSNDGMDMVVCEFNLKTRQIRFASAMRPIIMVMSGESYYIKGNRSSVGGESAIDKYFDDQEYFLNEGDTVYLFSDGLPDQFGGIDGKKMKIARLKKLIDQIMKMRMADQEIAIMKFFDEWKGSYEQIDDILMMGIRV